MVYLNPTLVKDNTLQEKAKAIKLVILDIDGVCTDGGLYINNDGLEQKKFNVQDGLGIVLLIKSGIEVAIISGLNSQAVKQRMKYLGVKYVFLGQNEKIDAYEELLTNLNLKNTEVAYIGDDFPDLPLLKRAGLSVAVANAQEPVKKIAYLHTKLSGGQGAVREFSDWLLEQQGKLENIIKHYISL